MKLKTLLKEAPYELSAEEEARPYIQQTQMLLGRIESHIDDCLDDIDIAEGNIDYILGRNSEFARMFRAFKKNLDKLLWEAGRLDDKFQIHIDRAGL